MSNPTTNQTVQLGQLQRSPVSEAMLPAVNPGFGSLQAYELMLRQAKALSSSTLVPTQYRQIIQKLDRDGQPKGPAIENPNAIPNCMIALNMATRMNADPLMVMQNLVVVEGRPSWSSQWVIAQINNCGRFEPLRFDMVSEGPKDVQYEFTEWGEQRGQRVRKTATVHLDDNIICVAWTVPKGVQIPNGVVTLKQAIEAGLPVLKGPKVSMEIAVKEGWLQRSGSKWQTMPELMLHYRSGAFFGRLYAPELLMGIPSEDEVRDMGVLQQAADGTYAPAATGATGGDNPSVESLRAHANARDDDQPHPQAEGDGGAAGTEGEQQRGAAEADGPSEGTATEKPAAKADERTQTAARASAKPAQQHPTGGDGLFGAIE